MPTMTMHDGLAERVCVLEAKDEIRRWPDLAGNVLAPQVGRDAIVQRFAGPLPPVLHLLSNESITVNGDDAAGSWTYLQPAVLDGRAYWVAGQYHIDFRKDDGRWPSA